MSTDILKKLNQLMCNEYSVYLLSSSVAEVTVYCYRELLILCISRFQSRSEDNGPRILYPLVSQSTSDSCSVLRLSVRNGRHQLLHPGFAAIHSG